MIPNYGVTETVRQMCLADPVASRLTESVVRSALADMRPPPAKSFEWLALAVQSAVHFGRQFADETPEETNSAIRDRLGELSTRAYGLWRDLFDLSDSCREILDYGMTSETYASTDEIHSAEYRRFQQLSTELEWLALYLKEGAATAGTAIERPHWAQARQKRLRIWIGRCLALIYESGFGKKLVVKNDGSNHQPESFGAFADFFCRILRAAGIESAGANLKEVLDEVRRLHRAERVSFVPGILPE